MSVFPKFEKNRFFFVENTAPAHLYSFVKGFNCPLDDMYKVPPDKRKIPHLEENLYRIED